MTVDLIDWYFDSSGKLVKWMRGTPVSLETPGAPTTVRASLSGTTGTVTWAAPATNGGSPITSYTWTATWAGGGSASGSTPDPTVLTAAVTVPSGTTSVTFTVAAVNDVGTGPTASATASATTAARFPGDTRSLLTGQILLGIDEADKDPTRVTSPEVAAPETLATQTVGGVTKHYQCAGIRYYFNTWSAMNVPSGAWATAVQTQYDAGRIAFGEIHIAPGTTGDNWAQAADGRHDSLIDAFIVWCEETAPDVPTPATFSHEPNFSSTPGLTAADFGHFFRYFRSRMDLYAAAHGGVGVYQWKHLSVGPVFTAQNFNASNPGPAYVGDAWNGAAKITATADAASDVFTATSGHLLSNGRKVTLLSPPAGLNTTSTYYVIAATATTFKLSATLGGAAVDVTASGSGITVVSNDVWDWMGADPYISRNGSISSYWTTNMAAFVGWCEDLAHTYPMAVSEFGIYNRDPQAATKLGQFFDALTNGSHDVWIACYYNSGDQANPSPSTLWTQFILDNVSNGGLLNEYVALLRDPRSVRFWNLTRPDGNPYAKPAGVP